MGSSFSSIDKKHKTLEEQDMLDTLRFKGITNSRQITALQQNEPSGLMDMAQTTAKKFFGDPAAVIRAAMAFNKGGVTKAAESIAKDLTAPAPASAPAFAPAPTGPGGESPMTTGSFGATNPATDAGNMMANFGAITDLLKAFDSGDKDDDKDDDGPDNTHHNRPNRPNRPNHNKRQYRDEGDEGDEGGYNGEYDGSDITYHTNNHHAEKIFKRPPTKGVKPRKSVGKMPNLNTGKRRPKNEAKKRRSLRPGWI